MSPNPPIQPTYTPPAHQGLDIRYQDRDLLLLNKPAGLLCVPGRGADKQDCLATRVQAEFPAARIVHRLDMETSGLLLMALSAEVQRRLGMQFERRELRKEYIALVAGRLAYAAGTIDLPLHCDWPRRPRQKVDHLHGKAALTHYQLLSLDSTRDASRLLLRPVTGRSHQLRVHLWQLGHPIIGDRLYGTADDMDRLRLHASLLAFAHPRDGRPLTITCPPDF